MLNRSDVVITPLVIISILWGHGVRYKQVIFSPPAHLMCSSSARRWPAPLTCGGQHGAGEKQRRGEVPVPVCRGVIEDGNPIITGLQGFFQKPLQTLLGQTLIFLQELAFNGPQLLTKLVLIRQLHRRKHDSTEYEIKDVPQDQRCKIPRRFVTLDQAHTRITGERLKHYFSFWCYRSLRT